MSDDPSEIVSAVIMIDPGEDWGYVLNLLLDPMKVDGVIERDVVWSVASHNGNEDVPERAEVLLVYLGKENSGIHKYKLVLTVNAKDRTSGKNRTWFAKCIQDDVLRGDTEFVVPEAGVLVRIVESFPF